MSNDGDSSVNVVDSNSGESQQDLINLINQLSLTSQSGSQNTVESQQGLIDLINQLSLTNQSGQPNSEESQPHPVDANNSPALANESVPDIATNDMDTQSLPTQPQQQQQQPCITITSALATLAKVLNPEPGPAADFPQQLQVMLQNQV